MSFKKKKKKKKIYFDKINLANNVSTIIEIASHAAIEGQSPIALAAPIATVTDNIGFNHKNKHKTYKKKKERRKRKKIIGTNNSLTVLNFYINVVQNH